MRLKTKDLGLKTACRISFSVKIAIHFSVLDNKCIESRSHYKNTSDIKMTK